MPGRPICPLVILLVSLYKLCHEKLRCFLSMSLFDFGSLHRFGALGEASFPAEKFYNSLDCTEKGIRLNNMAEEF